MTKGAFRPFRELYHNCRLPLEAPAAKKTTTAERGFEFAADTLFRVSVDRIDGVYRFFPGILETECIRIKNAYTDEAAVNPAEKRRRSARRPDRIRKSIIPE